MHPYETPAPDSVFSSSLDAQETSLDPFEVGELARADPLELQSVHQNIAHARHQGSRRKIIHALHDSLDAPVQKRARRIAACCCCPTFRSDDTGKIGVNLARCRDRLCPLCCRRRGYEAAAKVTALSHDFNAPRLMTLTLKATPDPLIARVHKLFFALGAIRAMKQWKERITGGVWALEVTRNQKTGFWHAHLHIIVDGTFFPQPLLKKLWEQATGDSFIVDIRAIHDRHEAAKYVAAYLSKPFDVATWPDEAIREYAAALHGRRLMQPFGSARSVDLDDDTEESPAAATKLLCTSHCLYQATSAGYEPARHAAEVLSRLGVDFAIAAGITPSTSRSSLPPVEEWEMAMVREVLGQLAFAWPDLPGEAKNEPSNRAKPPPDEWLIPQGQERQASALPRQG